MAMSGDKKAKLFRKFRAEGMSFADALRKVIGESARPVKGEVDRLDSRGVPHPKDAEAK
jgi:hypothetical protein